MDLVDPKVKVTILLRIIRGARERGGRKFSIYSSMLNAAKRCNSESVQISPEGE